MQELEAVPLIDGSSSLTVVTINEHAYTWRASAQRDGPIARRYGMQTRLGMAVLAGVLLSGCTGGSPQVAPSSISTPLAPSPMASATSAAQSPIFVPTDQPSGQPEPLTDAEVVALSGGVGHEPPADAPPPVIDSTRAEEIVRSMFRGERALIGIRRVTMTLQNGTFTGWMVALTPVAGRPCSFNAGFLSRPIEGQIVNDQTGEEFWIFGCPESLP